MFFHEGILVGVETSRLAEDCVRDSHFANIVKEGGDFEILKLGFFQAEFLPNAHAPFREASAVYSGIEILKIEELIERADNGIAERGGLLFKLLDAERLQRRGNRETFGGRWSLMTRHGCYRQNNQQLPEPDEEPELLTQAETAW
jgi:hypothetical protein